jgi:hypothetical protein
MEEARAVLHYQTERDGQEAQRFFPLLNAAHPPLLDSGSTTDDTYAPSNSSDGNTILTHHTSTTAETMVT